MITNGFWNAIYPKDSQIMALTTKENELIMKKDGTRKPNDRRSKGVPIAHWRKKKGVPVVEMDSLDCHWCETRERKYCKGLHVRHKIEECNRKNCNARRAKTDKYRKSGKSDE